MKRSKYLVPLSWEHHSALLNANRLQKGLANQTPKGILLDFLKYIWENDGSADIPDFLKLFPVSLLGVSVE